MWLVSRRPALVSTRGWSAQVRPRHVEEQVGGDVARDVIATTAILHVLRVDERSLVNQVQFIEQNGARRPSVARVTNRFSLHFPEHLLLEGGLRSC